MPPLLIKLLMERVRSAPLPFFLKPIARAIPDRLDAAYTDPEIERHLAFLEAELAEREHFAGPDFTAADIQMFFPLESLAQVVDLPTRAPRLADFLTRMHQRDAYQRAVEVGGALDLGAV